MDIPKSEKIINHIVPSGCNKSLCGLNTVDIEYRYSSLGLDCSCKKCLKIANKILIIAKKE